MHRIDHTTAVPSLPTPAAAGTPGYFTGGDPVGGTPATVVTQDWANSIQEEIMSVLTAAGITPDKTAVNQLLLAIRNVALSTAGGIVTANSASAALRVVQTGSGPVFEAFDAAGDGSPFVIDADGNVLIGATTLPPNTKMFVDRTAGSVIPALSAGTALTLAGSSGSGTPCYLQLISGNASTTEIRFGDSDSAARGALAYDHSTDILTCLVAGTGEVWRSAAGNFLLGTAVILNPTSTTDEGANFSTGGAKTCVMSRNGNPALQLQRTGTDGSVQAFYKGTTSVGSIALTATGTSYNVTSDAGLKNDDGELSFKDARAIMDLVVIHRFRWKSTDESDLGAFAQELFRVYPRAVTPGGWFNEESGDLSEEGKEGAVYVPWSVDYSKLVPVMSVCIQGEMKRTDAIMSRLDALENAG